MALGTNYKRNKDRESVAIEKRLKMSVDFAKYIQAQTGVTYEVAIDESCKAILKRGASQETIQMFATFNSNTR